MKITFDHNSDTITLNDNGDYKIKGDMRKIQNLIVEIMNELDPTDVLIEQIDEDVRSTVEEW